ncbi:MAG: DUF1294 domain-containing protein [Clostridia bacterium]|nr:DUF1294 domain-containing protein [Clostridia bacterium]
MKYLLLALLCWNLWVFLLMGVDKRKAKKGRRRISERTLLLSALAFGAVGGLAGMHLFHHKTLHKRFRYGLPAMLIFHVALGAAGIYWYLTYWQ